MVEITSRRGTVLEPARIGDIAPGVVFIPFHYGYWDHPDRARAANELAISGWDPVSKQPLFKYAAVSIRKYDGGVQDTVVAAATNVITTVKHALGVGEH